MFSVTNTGTKVGGFWNCEKITIVIQSYLSIQETTAIQRPKENWEYDSQAVLLQAANSKPRQITSGTMPQEAREELATQTIDNIDPLGININASNNKNPEKSGSARHSVANDGGFRSSDPHKEELWAKFIVKIAKVICDIRLDRQTTARRAP